MKIIKKILQKKNIKWAALLLIIIIVVVLFFTFRRKTEEVRIEDHELYQYLTGIKVEYTGRIKINKEDDDITTITFKDESVDLDSTPIYYKDEIKAIFPKNMIVMYPSQGKLYKINYFSTIYQDIEDVYIKDGSLNRIMSKAIIYDGNDLYFLTGNYKVKVNEEEFELKAMSYIIVDTLNSVVQIYDYANDNFTIIPEVKKDVIITGDGISVNATNDLMYYNGTSKLILKNIDVLKNLE